MSRSDPSNSAEDRASLISTSPEGSFFSCANSTSTSAESSYLSAGSTTGGTGSYYSAAEDQNQDQCDGEEKHKLLSLSPSKLKGKMNATIDDNASTTTTETLERDNSFDCFEDDEEISGASRPRPKFGRSDGSSTLADEESLRVLSSSNGEDEEDNNVDGFEVKADVSRLCNEIAECEKPDYEKQTEIERMTYGDLDLDRLGLKKLSISSGGLLSNSLRRRAWPLLLGIRIGQETSYHKIPKDFPNVTQQIKDLVTIDVARVLKRFPPGLSEPQQDHLQTYLSSLICAVLDRNPTVHYYQGFHDIALTFLLVFLSQNAPYIAYLCINKMIENNLKPFMEETMETTHNLIHVLFALLEVEDNELFRKIVILSKCPVAFCLPWVLCWFAHTLPNDTDIFRLYDFILGCNDKINPPCLIPIFISASLVLRNSKAIKQNVQDTELATMHHELAQLPSKLEDLEPWLEESLELMGKYAGREQLMMNRGIEIRVFQNQLWNQEPSNRPRAVRKPRPWVKAIKDSVQFIFYKHGYVTLAIVLVGTAILIQYKYNGSLTPIVKQMSKLSTSLSYLYKSAVEKVGKIMNSVSEFELE